jgi:TonB family protein
VREGYPSAGPFQRTLQAGLAGALSAGVAVLALLALHPAAARLPQGRRGLDLELPKAPVPVFELDLPDEPAGGNGGVGEGGQGSSRSPASLSKARWGDVLDLAPTQAASDLPDRVGLSPGVIFSDSADGRAPGGSGQGGGGGTGTGHGRSWSNEVKSAAHTGGIRMEQDDLTLVHREIPIYPPLAMAACIQGVVAVQVLVSEDGVPLKMDLESSPNELLTQETLRVLPMWRFKPVVLDRERVRVKVRITVSYRLI